MTVQREKSKRQALRFSVSEHPVRYKTEFEDGSAVMENVSTGGCAMSSLNVQLSLQEKILLLFDLDEDPIEIGAEVVRIENNTTAVQFTDLAEDYSSKLVKYFARKQRSSRSS